MNAQGNTGDERCVLCYTTGLNYHNGLLYSSSSLSQLRTRQLDSDSRDGWVGQIAHQLLENRKGRNPPSQDLADAERKLAEVREDVCSMTILVLSQALNSRREYQARQIREYRLSAFTADAII